MGEIEPAKHSTQHQVSNECQSVSRVQPSAPLPPHCFHQSDHCHLLPGLLQLPFHWALPPMLVTVCSLHGPQRDLFKT